MFISQGSKGATETAYFGTVKADPNFNAENDAAKLKQSIETKGKYHFFFYWGWGVMPQ